MTKEHFDTVVRWKSPRSTGYAELNDADTIGEVTAAAIGGDMPDWCRAQILTVLHGVEIPVVAYRVRFTSRARSDSVVAPQWCPDPIS